MHSLATSAHVRGRLSHIDISKLLEIRDSSETHLNPLMNFYICQYAYMGVVSSYGTDGTRFAAASQKVDADCPIWHLLVNITTLSNLKRVPEFVPSSLLVFFEMNLVSFTSKLKVKTLPTWRIKLQRKLKIVWTWKINVKKKLKVKKN